MDTYKSQRDDDPSSSDTTAVIIVNYNSVLKTRDCVNSLLCQPVKIIWILDNSGSEAELEELNSAFNGLSNVRIYSTGQNLGFGRGVNHAISIARTEFNFDNVWIVNPDTISMTGALDALRRSLKSTAGPSVLSPLILTGIQPDVMVWYSGGKIDMAIGSVAHLKYGELFVPGKEHAVVRRTDFVTGAAPFMSLATWDLLGGFREDLFLYWEDVEFSMRCDKLGIQMMVVTDAIIWHEEGGTSVSKKNERSEIYYFYMARNRIRLLAEKNGLKGLWVRAALVETFKCIFRPIAARESGAARKSYYAFRATVGETFRRTWNVDSNVRTHCIGEEF